MVSKPTGQPNGRPPVMTAETVKKLLDAFSYGMTDEQSCIYAGISKQTLYNYCDKHPAFIDQKELLKHKPSLKAKMNLVKRINENDIDVSKRRSERKNKDEFSLRQEQTGKDGGPIEVQNVPLTTNQKRIIAMGVLDKLNSMDDSDQENLAIEQV